MQALMIEIVHTVVLKIMHTSCGMYTLPHVVHNLMEDVVHNLIHDILHNILISNVHILMEDVHGFKEEDV